MEKGEEMRVIDDGKTDKFGKYPIKFKGYKNVEEIWEYLKRNYDGHIFCIMLNTVKDGYDGDEYAYVYFVDDVIDEIAAYSDYTVSKKEGY